jgi:hypothetical protein
MSNPRFTRRLGRRLTVRLADNRQPNINPASIRDLIDTGRPRPPADLRLKRDNDRPYKPHLEPDLEIPVTDIRMKPSARVLDMLRELPRPLPVPIGDLICAAQWNSVALFFNLDMPAADRPAGYAVTTAADAKNWLDEGTDPMNPGISGFMCRYWKALSYGNLAFGVNTPRNATGDPLVPSVEPFEGDPKNWGKLIRRCIDANPNEVWEAGGSLTKDGKRWIPSVVLVQRYDVHATAAFGAFEHTTGGNTYIIGDRTHMKYALATWSPAEAPAKKGRKFWGTLCHEYSHNFLEFGDLYGPSGCTGYWDLLGDNSPPGRMSEVSSALKVRIGWLNYKQIYNGPNLSSRNLSLNPYTTTGDAYKVVPDPANTPHEYFILEYRKSTGAEVWRPDGGLPEEGLLITHINERIGRPSTWLNREAPFYDPEFADDPVQGYVDWTGHNELTGKLFPQGSENSFTRTTVPSSMLYGERDSGLSITNIRIDGGKCKFTMAISATPRVGWNVSVRDRALAGSFTSESTLGGEEVFIRNGDEAALLVHRECQWLTVRKQIDWIGGWNLGTSDRELVADLDGDGFDEIYIRSPNWAGVLKWRLGRFRSVTVQHDWIDGWNLGTDNREYAADLDGDGQAEIYIRSPEWAGVIKLLGGRLRLQSIQHDWIDQWNLGADNEEFIGRFTQPGYDEIAIRSPNWLGLLRWDPSANRLKLVKIQHDWVDTWNLGADNWHFVGDFDGDGLDEIYIRSPKWAGIFKWSAGRFRCVWIKKDELDHVNAKPEHALALTGDDSSYSGRFRYDRDAILHRTGDRVAVVAWETDAMKVHKVLKSSFNNRWNLGSNDKFVLGDFHRSGADLATTPKHTVIDGITDVFIHNGWGTGMVGVNHGPRDPANPTADILDQMGLTWIQQGKIMMDE